MGVCVLQALVGEVVEHEQALVQLRMLPHPFHQRLALPADASGDAQPRLRTLGPGTLEGIQQVTVVLPRLDGADHQEYRRLGLEHAQQVGLDGGAVLHQVQLRTQVEIIEPALRDLLRADAPQHLRAHFVADGLGNRDVAVGGGRDPVEPVVEHLDQSGIAELRMGQGNQVVDHRDDAHALALEAFRQREEIGVPGGVQQDQLVAGPMFERGRAHGCRLLLAEDAVEQAQRNAEEGEGEQAAGYIEKAPGPRRGTERAALFQGALAQPEVVGGSLHQDAQAYQRRMRPWVQRRQAVDLIQGAVEHCHRDALHRLVGFRQLADDVAHHPLNTGIDLGMLEHIGAFDQQTRHGVLSAEVGSRAASPERLIWVSAPSQEQPTKSSWRLLMTWKTRP